MELRHLRYFIAVAEEGSLTLAAENRLHTAQPSLSRQIRDLEYEEEDLVAELDRRLHLTALDEVGVGLKNRIELLDSWNLLAVEYTAARLINHTVSETTKVLDLLARLRDRQIGDHTFAARFTGLPERCSCAFDDFLVNPNEFAICRSLLL